jgi:DNA-binding IclR family transcriptional regulator
MNHSEVIHSYILKNKKVTTEEILKITGLRKVTVQRVLNHLRTSGYLRKDDNGFWVDGLE